MKKPTPPPSGGQARRPGYGILCPEAIGEMLRRLGEAARKLVERIRSSEPSRAVRGGACNVRGTYPSAKMGRTIQYESHSGERVAIGELEIDPDVCEYYEQPAKIPLRYRSPSGRWVTAYHTPDFFVVRKDVFEFVECKTEESLQQLTAKSPGRWTLEGDTFRCPPAERWAAEHGMRYRVICTTYYTPEFRRNVEYIDDHLRSTQLVPQAVINRVVAAARKQPGRTIKELMAEASVGREIILLLIARGQLFCDLGSHLLREPERCQVYAGANQALAYSMLASVPRPKAGILDRLSPGALLECDGQQWKLLSLGNTQALIQRDGGKTFRLPLGQLEGDLASGLVRCLDDGSGPAHGSPALTILGRATDEDVGIAIQRARMLDGEIGADVTERTLYYWRKRRREAELLCGLGLIGLLPRTHRQGRRTPRFPILRAKTLELIWKHHLDRSRPRTQAAYRLIAAELKKAGHKPPSPKTFRSWLGQISEAERVRAREGDRAAYAIGEHCWYLSADTPVHGEYPWHIVHMDHTLLDIEIVDEDGRPLGRPWLSLALDAYSRMVLGYSLSFASPSYASVMAVLRDMVRRHTRLPQTLVTDNGKEFDSIAYRQLTSIFQITKKLRPPAKARFGSVIERFFGTTHAMFVHNLRGNTQATRELRKMTRKVNPKRLAVWTMQAFWPALEGFFVEYAERMHRTLGESPAVRYRQGMDAENRPMRIVDKPVFDIYCLPPTRKGTATVDSGAGLTANNLRYWHLALADRRLHGSKVEVRYDPTDVSYIFARVEGAWLRCECKQPDKLKGTSLKLLQYITGSLHGGNGASQPGPGTIETHVVKSLERAKTEEQRLMAAREAAIAKASPDAKNGNNGAGSAPPRTGQNGSSTPKKRSLSQLSKSYKPKLLPPIE